MSNATDIEVCELSNKPIKPSFSFDSVNYLFAEKAPEIVGKFYGREIDQTKLFDNFVIGQSNREAVKMAMQLAKNPGKHGIHSTVFLHSSPGLGKTHLMYAIANEIMKLHPNLNLALLSGRNFNKELVDAFQDQNSSSFFDRYSNIVDVLLIDDIHEFKGKPELQKMVFDIFRSLYAKGKQIVFTADNPPSKIFGSSDSILSQLKWSKEISLKRPDYETRMRIIRQKKSEFKLVLEQRVEHLLAVNFPENIRVLEGALLKLNAYSELMSGTPLSIEQVVRFLGLKDVINPESVPFDLIAKHTASFYNSSVSKICSKDRDRDTQKVRTVTIYLAKTLGRFTFKEIGEKLGGRHHSTIMDAFEKLSAQLSEDTTIAKEIFEIESLLNDKF